MIILITLDLSVFSDIPGSSRRRPFDDALLEASLRLEELG